MHDYSIFWNVRCYLEYQSSLNLILFIEDGLWDVLDYE